MGNGLSCGEVADKDAGDHVMHAVNFLRFSDCWCCDLCRRNQHGLEDRFRCIYGCDFDVCRNCMSPHLGQYATEKITGKAMNLRHFMKEPQISLAHKHYVAYIFYICDLCKTVDQGARLHCEKHQYDMCGECVRQHVLGQHKEMTHVDREITKIHRGDKKYFKMKFKNETENRMFYIPRFADETVSIENTIDVYLKAWELAIQFNETTGNKFSLQFQKPILHLMLESVSYRDEVAFKKGDKVLLEEWIEDDFVKFNSNTGWCRDDAAHTLPDAFTHFSWHQTRHLILCDLKGGHHMNTGYILSEPWICSRITGTWGVTDLGTTAIDAFFQNHRCSSLCEQWHRPTPSTTVDAAQVQKATSFEGVLKPVNHGTDNWSSQLCMGLLETEEVRLPVEERPFEELHKLFKELLLEKFNDR